MQAPQNKKFIFLCVSSTEYTLMNILTVLIKGDNHLMSSLIAYYAYLSKYGFLFIWAT